MKNLFVPGAALLCFVFVSCNNKKEFSKDPAILYAEISNPSAVNTLSAEEKEKGWQLLFDGETGNGWHGYNQKGIPDCWTVEDGRLTMNTTGGGESQDVITDKIYKNFAFTCEYKLTEGANSGIIYQVKEDEKYEFPYETGSEYQIMDNDNWPDELEDWQIHGANYAMYPPAEKPYKPAGEWNRMLLIVDGNDVTYMLNGVVTVKYTKYDEEWTKLRNSGKWSDFPDYGKYDEGCISLQNHGTKVWFRDIKIKEF